MSTRVRLGRTELSVSPICYGSWQLSPKWWGDVPEKDAIAGIKNPQQIADAAGAMGKTVSKEDGYKVRSLLSI